MVEKKLSTEQWLLLIGAITAFALTVGSLDTWKDLENPKVVAGFLMQATIQLRSLFADRNTVVSGDTKITEHVEKDVTPKLG